MKLRLTPEEAGRNIGDQKDESAQTLPSEAALGLIELLDRHPEEIRMLHKLRALPPLPTAPQMDVKTKSSWGGHRKLGLVAA